MASFVVLRHADASSHNGLEKTVFVRDAFSVVAFIMPLIWLLWNRLWFHASMVLLACGMLFALAQNINLVPLVYILGILVSAFAALEGPAWRIKTLMLKGYIQTDVIDANNLKEAELRFAMHQPANEAPQKPRGKLIDAPSNNIQDDLILGSTGTKR